MGCRKCREKKSRPARVESPRPKPIRRADRRKAQRAERNRLLRAAKAADQRAVELSASKAVGQGVVLVGVADAELATQAVLRDTPERDLEAVVAGGVVQE